MTGGTKIQIGGGGINPNTIDTIASDIVIAMSDVKDTISDLLDIRSDIVTVQSDLADIKSDLTETNSDVKSILSDLGDIISDLTETNSDVKSVISDLVDIWSDLVITHSDVKIISSDTPIRTISGGSKLIASAGTKYFSFDSGTSGAEIISIIVKGLIGAAWTLDVYVPTDDAVASPAAGDKRDTIEYQSTDTEGGLLQGFGIIYNGFLNLTNNGAGNQTISDAVIVYRSRAALSVAWEA